MKFVFNRITAGLKAGKIFYIMISLVLAGILVTLVELTCTGQVYLPFIMFLARQKYLKGYFYLILYNLIFVAPLIILSILFKSLYIKINNLLFPNL